jgi:HEPN domain-containing protein
MTSTDKFEEWFFQSDYDLGTAEDMFKSGRYIYCIFMCHLSLEKALKGLLIKNTGEFPIKSHSLVYFAEKIGLELDENRFEFIYMLNKISVPTRYPENLKKLFNDFTKQKTKVILNQTKEVQSWIKQK